MWYKHCWAFNIIILLNPHNCSLKKVMLILSSCLVWRNRRLGEVRRGPWGHTSGGRWDWRCSPVPHLWQHTPDITQYLQHRRWPCFSGLFYVFLKFSTVQYFCIQKKSMQCSKQKKERPLYPRITVRTPCPESLWVRGLPTPVTHRPAGCCSATALVYRLRVYKVLASGKVPDPHHNPMG